MDRNLALSEMWDEYCNNGVGICVICSKCGGSSTAFCCCARTAWEKKVTDKQIDQFIQQKKKKELQQIELEEKKLQKRREELQKL